MLCGRERMRAASERLQLSQVTGAPFIKFSLKGTDVLKVGVSSRPDASSLSLKDARASTWGSLCANPESDVEKRRDGSSPCSPHVTERSPQLRTCPQAEARS